MNTLLEMLELVVIFTTIFMLWIGGGLIFFRLLGYLLGAPL